MLWTLTQLIKIDVHEFLAPTFLGILVWMAILFIATYTTILCPHICIIFCDLWSSSCTLFGLFWSSKDSWGSLFYLTSRFVPTTFPLSGTLESLLNLLPFQDLFSSYHLLQRTFLKYANVSSVSASEEPCTSSWCRTYCSIL